MAVVGGGGRGEANGAERHRYEDKEDESFLLHGSTWAGWFGRNSDRPGWVPVLAVVRTSSLLLRMVGLSARLSVVCVPGSPHINGWVGLWATEHAERRDWRARASLAIRYQHCASTGQTRKKTATEPLLIPRYGNKSRGLLLAALAR